MSTGKSSHIRNGEAQGTGAWFTKPYLEKMYTEAQEESNLGLTPSKRSHVFRKIKGVVFLWAGIPKSKESLIKKGVATFHRQGFNHVRLIDGEFYIAK